MGGLEQLVMEVIRARQRYSILSTPDTRHRARQALKKQTHSDEMPSSKNAVDAEFNVLGKM